jgi:hypothetical protein
MAAPRYPRHGADVRANCAPAIKNLDEKTGEATK